MGTNYRLSRINDIAHCDCEVILSQVSLECVLVIDGPVFVYQILIYV